jgi:hypothetical protein
MFYRTYLQESNETGCDNYEESQITFHLHEFSLGGSTYTSTGKTNTNKYT